MLKYFKFNENFELLQKMKFKYIASLVLEILKLWLKFHDSPKFSEIRKFFARLELSR